MNLIDITLIGAGIILIVLFVLLKSTKVPKVVYKSKTIYSDHKEKPEKALFSSKYGIVGKPDFILHTKDGFVSKDAIIKAKIGTPLKTNKDTTLTVIEASFLDKYWKISF